MNLLTATGRMASVFGPDYADADFRQRLWAHAKVSRSRYPHLSREVRSLVESFVAGVIAWMREPPRACPAWAFEPEPYQVVALGRYLTWQEMEHQAEREYDASRDPKAPSGSNAWVLGRERSAEDAVILCVDPHEDWDGPGRWYEAHLHGGALHAYGFTRPGLPVLWIGHNDHLGWSAAPGGPDAADVFEIELDSASGSRYRYDDAWRSVETDTVLVQVIAEAGMQTRARRMQRTHHGPIFHRQGARAYAYRLAGSDPGGAIEQLYRQMTASDLKGFRDALALAQVGPQRIVYGDVHGNIYYTRTGPVPVRSEVYRWGRPVPGNTSATEWGSRHEQEDLIRLANPTPGWVQDCGTSPDMVTRTSPLDPDRYPDYVYNARPATESPRSLRAQEVLAALSRMTLREAFDLALDTYVVGSERWQAALQEAYVSHGTAFRSSRGIWVWPCPS